MRNRKFGVEIEMGFHGGYTAAVDLLRDEVAKGDINPEWGQSHTQDGTLIEVRSPILSGKEGFDEIHKVMDLLTANGGYVTSNDGMHVHHDAPDFVNDIDATRRLVRNWVTNRDVIYKFVPNDRRFKMCCPSWGERNVEDLFETRTQEDFKHWPRFDLNVGALDSHGTVEIRLHQGCLDPVQAEAWIRFGQAFLNRAALVSKELPKFDDHTELLDRIRAHTYSRTHLSVYA